MDTSVAVALTVADDQHHEGDRSRRCRATTRAGGACRLRDLLGAHPPAAVGAQDTACRRPPSGEQLPGSRFLGARTTAWLLGELQTHGIAGDAVYDALVGAAAKEHGLPLVTRDRRALDVYRGFDVDVQMLG